MKTVYDFSVKDRKGKDVSLKEYANEVLLIVNTATKCGFTPQYEELEALYKKYHSQGFEILDFPCNQFGQQAPGTDESIHEFCKLNFGTEFPRFKKVKVNGEDAEPLFKFLTEQKGFAGWDMSHPIAHILDGQMQLTACAYKARNSMVIPDTEQTQFAQLIGEENLTAQVHGLLIIFVTADTFLGRGVIVCPILGTNSRRTYTQ